MKRTFNNYIKLYDKLYSVFHDKASFRFTAEIFARFIICTESISLVSQVSTLHMDPENPQTNPLNINNHASFRFKYPALLESYNYILNSMYCKLTLSPISITCCYLGICLRLTSCHTVSLHTVSVHSSRAFCFHV